MADFTFTVGADPDEASFAAAGNTAGQLIGKGIKEGSKEASRAADNLAKDLTAMAKRVQGQLANALKTGVDVRQFAPLERGLERILTLQRQISQDRARLGTDTKFRQGVEAEFKAINSLTSSQTRELQSTIASLNIQGRRENAQLQKDASARNIALQRDAQIQINAARTAGKARIVLAQQVGAQLLSAERIISNGVTNIIRGTAKAVGKVWDSTVGSLKRTFTERKTVIEGGLKNESRLFTQTSIISQRANTGLLGAIGNNLGTIGGGLAIGAAARQIFTLGSEFTRGLNVLQAQLQLTNEQMKEVDKLSIKLGNDISLPGVSALDAAQGIGLLAKQFANLGPQAITAAEAAAKGTLQLARAVGAAPEEAAATVGAAVNVFGEQAANATAVADQLTAALSQAAGTSFTDFSQAFTQGAAVVSSFITPADGATNAITEFSSALAVLARGGLVGQDAGTSIKQFFLQANRGTKEVAGALDEISKRAGVTGTAFFDASGKSRALVETISILQKGLEGLTTEQRASTLQTIFGSDATRVANILIGQGAAELLKAEAATQRQGAAADLAAAQNKGLAGAVDAIKSQFETFAIQIFQKVNPILGQAGLAIAGFIDKLANGEGAFAGFRKAILGIGAAFGAILAARGITEVAGLIGSIISLLGPFGIAIAGAGAILGIATGGFQNFGDTFQRLGEIAKVTGDAIRTGLSKAAAFLTRILAPAIKTVTDLIRPFTSRAGAFIQRIIDIGRAFTQAFSTGGFTFAIQNLKKNLASLGQDIGAVLAPVGRVIVDKLINVRDFALGVRDKIVAAFRSINFGTVFASIGSTISSVLSTSLGRNLTGAGIGAVAGGLIAGPLGAALGAAFGAAVAIAIPKLRDAISRIDVGALFGKLLDGVRKVGELIGKILSDKRTILAAAGIAAAAAALAVQFVQGFVSGILSNLGSIADAGATILNTLFSQNSITKSILALVIIFRSKLVSLFTSSKVGQEAGQVVGKNVADGAATGFLANSKKFASSTISALADVGKKAASGLVVALSAGLSGSALGSASNALEGGLAAAGLAASAAQAFAIGSATPAGPAGGAALAGATVGIGLISAALSANSKKAAEAKARMQEYKDAVDAAGKQGKDSSQAIQDVFSQKLLNASDATIRGLNDVGLSLATLQEQASKGDLSASVKTLNDELKVTRQQSTDLLNKGDIVGANKAAKRAAELSAALKFVNQQQKAISDEARRSSLEKSLTPGAGFTRLGTVIQGIIDKVREAVRQKKELIADVRAEQLLAKANTVKEGMKAIGDAAQTSRQQILDLLNPPEKKTPKQGGAQAALDVTSLAPDVSQAFLTGLDTAIGSAQLETALAKIDPFLQSAVQDGLGNAFTPEQIAANLATVKTAVTQGVTPDGQPISAEVQKALLDGIAAFEQTKVPQVIQIQAVADLRTAALAGSESAAAALAALGQVGPISIQSKADLAAAQTSGGDIINSADSIVANLPLLIPSKADKGKAINAGNEIFNAAQGQANKPIKVGSTVTTNADSASRAGNAIARSVMDGFVNGVNGANRTIEKTVTSVFAGVTATAKATFKISSPSKVFMGIGEDLMKGLAIGINTGSEEAVAAANEVANALIKSSETVAGRLATASASALDTIFKGVFESAGTQAKIAGLEATRGLTSAFEGIRKSVEDEAAALFQAASTAVNERTPEQNRIIARSDFASVFNLSNSAAIQSAVQAIEAFGASLLAQGQSADQAAQAMIAYRNTLLATAAAAGLNVDQVAALVDQLGLGNDALNQFVQLGRQATAVVGAAPGFTPAPPAPLTTGPNPTTIFNVDNRFDLPFGDPEAVSLAVVNRLAHMVR